MRHKINKNKFKGKSPSQRKGLALSLLKSLFIKEKINSIHKRLKIIKVKAEKIITIAKKDINLSFPILMKYFQGDKRLVSKVSKDISKRYANRNGGCVKLLKNGFRKGDNSAMSILKLT